MNTVNMTQRQKRVYEAICRFRKERNDKIGPSRRELATALRMSINGVQGHLESLRKKGFVSWDSDVQRSLDIVSDANTAAARRLAE
jgi:SOS-response transcriptional repressor LexA